MTEPQEPRGTSAEHPASEELSDFAFSPEAAAEGLREHLEDCPGCATEVADLRTVLASLAQLPEPAVPMSVSIRLDAAIARAWQEADTEAEAAAQKGSGDAVDPRSLPARRGPLWRKLMLPLGAACLVVLAVVGAGKLLSGGNSARSSASTAAGAVPGPLGDPALTQWVQSVLSGYASAENGGEFSPGAGGSSSSRPYAQALCSAAPAHAGYSELTTSQREFHGQPATLVVYQNDQEPASRPLFAIVYAGSCPTASSVILDEGVVSR